MDLKKIQKYLWLACAILSLICMGAAIWLCTTEAADTITYAMVVIFALASFWGYKRFKA